jgi:hypothetical protein
MILLSGLIFSYNKSTYIILLEVIYSLAIISVIFLYILRDNTKVSSEMYELVYSFNNDKYDIFGYKIYYNYTFNGVKSILSALNEAYFLSMIIIALMLCLGVIFIFENEREKEIKND